MAISTIALALVFAVLIGLSLGFLGGGGSILTVPILLYVLGMPAHQAIATSLFVVGTTSIAAMTQHARVGNVRYKVGAIFGAASMVGAYSAGRVAKLIPPTALLVLFGAMMLITAIAMMRGPKKQTASEEAKQGGLSIPLILVEGLVVGAFTGLVGAGGGFLVVPALVLLGRLPMREAVGTSLMVIAMKSFAGFAGYLATVQIDWTITLLVSAAAVVGSFGGAALASRVNPALLRKGFAWFVVVMGVFILVQELPKALGFPLTLQQNWPIILGAVAIPTIAAIFSLVRSPAPKPEHALPIGEPVKGAP
jgi:hypothetical protein